MMNDNKQTRHTDDTYDNDDTSGFTKAPDAEHDAAGTLPTEKGYANISEHYVSKSGSTRLFTATRYGKRYMLKCLKPDYLFTPVYQQALAKEFEIGLQLEHPNICRTFEMEDIDGLGNTIVMEHIDGETLQTLIDERRLSAELALGIVSQLMDALAYMHSKQVTHRDIKPANIMVTHTGRNVKLIDFGLSDSDLFNVLKMPAGTYRYIAPEQLLPGAVAEPKADIYSLGMVIEDMAMATGSKRLRRMARICATKDSALRPDSIKALRTSIKKDQRDVRTAAILAILVATLACIVAASLFLRNQTPPDNAPYPTGEGQAAQHDDNRIIDYGLWDKK